MGGNPGPSDWGQPYGPEHRGHMPPQPQRPPRKSKRRLSGKTWLMISGTVIVLGIIGSLLPDRPRSTGTAFPTTTPGPLTAAPSTPPTAKVSPTVTPTQRTMTATATPTPTPAPMMNAQEASNRWWFDQGGNQIESSITALDSYEEAAREGEFANAQQHCWQLQDYASVRSPHSILSLPDLDPAVGADLVRAFENGRKDIQVVADRCADFFEKDDRRALSQSMLFASGASTQLRKVQAGLLRLQRNTAGVPQTECLGASFRYEKIIGLSCGEAIAVLDRVQKTGTVQGARNLETNDYLCLYAGYMERRDGQPDVICRHKTTDRLSFEALRK